MSVYFNQTNLTPGTSQFITRNEVIQGLSTLAGDLSGVNISSIFFSPNPSFSSITMNPTGSISGAASVSATQVLGLSSAQLAYTSPYGTAGPFITSLKAAGGPTYQSLGLGGAVIKAAANASNAYTVIAPTSAAIFNTANTPSQIWNINTGSMSLALTNISSINGANPTTAGTTFTNLTGSNLTTTGTLTSPQVVSVSSINGLAFNTPQVLTISSGGSSTLTANTPTTIYSSLLGSSFLPNTNYLFNIQIIVTNVGVTAYPIFFGVRLGGSSGQIVYPNNANLSAAGIPTNGAPINLSGIALTGTQTNLLEVIGLSVTGVSITVSVGTSPNNRVVLKLLT